MRDHLTDLGDVAVAVITFAPVDDLAAHRRHLEVPFALLADPERVVYRRFGLERGAIHKIWRPATLALYARLIRQGRKLRRPNQDTRQLGGDFVIDADGRLAWACRPDAPDARPDVSEIIAAVDASR